MSCASGVYEKRAADDSLDTAYWWALPGQWGIVFCGQGCVRMFKQKTESLSYSLFNRRSRRGWGYVGKTRRRAAPAQHVGIPLRWGTREPHRRRGQNLGRADTLIHGFQQTDSALMSPLPGLVLAHREAPTYSVLRLENRGARAKCVFPGYPRGRCGYTQFFQALVPAISQGLSPLFSTGLCRDIQAVWVWRSECHKTTAVFF